MFPHNVIYYLVNSVVSSSELTYGHILPTKTKFKMKVPKLHVQGKRV